MTDWPIRKIGTIDLDKLMAEIGHLKKPEIGPRQFPFQGRRNGNPDDAKGTDFNLRQDEFEFDTILYPNEYLYMNSIIEEYQMYRTRKMWMHEKFTYAWHVDNSPRIHIPLYTNEHNMWIIRDKDGKKDNVYRIPADGGVYLVDTTVPHTFLNANADPFLRTHIVGATTIPL
jgi:hypothetical protein